MQGFFAIALAEFIEVSAFQTFNTVDITIHPGIETLVGGGIFGKFRIEYDLIEWREVGVHAEFFCRTGQYGCSGHFRTGTTKCGDAGFVNTGLFHQVPALVVGRGAWIIHHQGNGFGQVHGGATADADHAGNGAELLFEVVGQFIYVSRLGFVSHIGEDHFIIATEGDTVHEGFAFEEMVDEEDHRFAVLTVGGQDFIELVERAAAVDDVADHFEIAESHRENFGKINAMPPSAAF